MIMTLTDSHYAFFKGIACRLDDMCWRRDLVPASLRITMGEMMINCPLIYHKMVFILHFADSDYFTEVPVSSHQDNISWIEQQEYEYIYIIPNLSLMILRELLTDDRREIKFNIQTNNFFPTSDRRYEMTTVVDDKIIKLNNVVDLKQRIKMLTSAYDRCL